MDSSSSNVNQFSKNNVSNHEMPLIGRTFGKNNASSDDIVDEKSHQNDFDKKTQDRHILIYI